MSTTLWTRALGVAGVTGGIVLMSAVASQAADNPLGDLLGGTGTVQGTDASSAAGEAAGQAGVGAPVTLGGVQLGLSTSSSQSSGSTTTHTDADGSSVETVREQASSDATDLGVDLGAITVDPAATLSGVVSGMTSSTDGAPDASATQGDATGDLAAALPVSIEGLAVTGVHQDASQDMTQTTVTTQDGATSTTGSSSSQESATAGGLVLDEVTADPAAALTGMIGGTTAVTDEGRTGSSQAQGTAGGAADVAAPVQVGGLTAGFDDARSSQRATWGSTTDRDGATSAWRETRADASRTGGALTTGGLTADPTAVLEGALTGRTLQADGARDASAQATDADGRIDLATPLHADGLAAQAWSQRASERASDRWVSDTDGTQRTTTWSQRADAVNPSFATGPVDADVLGWARGQVDQWSATTGR